MADGDFNQLVKIAASRHMAGVSDIADLKRLSGGASQETWSFDAVQAEGVKPMILRRAPGGTVQKTTAALGQILEAKVIQQAFKFGVTVPEVAFVLEESDGLGVGFVMGRIEGETLAPKILRDAAFDSVRPKLVQQCGKELAKIHAVPIDALDMLPTRTPQEDLQNVRAAYERIGNVSPVFELAFRWLDQNMLDPVPPKLVHGDFRIGNLIIKPEIGLTAVLDWEIAHLGDPMSDLAWICVGPWRFGRINNPVGGFGQKKDLFAAYEAAGGQKVDPERVRFWQIFGSLRWGVSCVGMAFLHLDGLDRSVERAAIGRRSSENEIDLMDLLMGVEHAA